MLLLLLPPLQLIRASHVYTHLAQPFLIIETVAAHHKTTFWRVPATEPFHILFAGKEDSDGSDSHHEAEAAAPLDHGLDTNEMEQHDSAVTETSQGLLEAR